MDRVKWIGYVQKDRKELFERFADVAPNRQIRWSVKIPSPTYNQ